MPEEKKYYLTKEGLIKLRAEYRHLKKIKTSKTKGEFPRVWQSEDLNPEYLSFQEDMAFIDTRLIELNNVLKNYQLIKIPPKEKRNLVNLGATVVVEVDGQIDEFTIVGSLEANPSAGKISNESPVGQALLGRKAGEEVAISSPINVAYKIKKIRYKIS
jgi:transcription elongation factor GreA